MKNPLNKNMKIFDPPDCKRFNGYKPCEPYKVCPCDQPIRYGRRILIINLDFIGDVLMTTAMLSPLKRKYPESTIHWITMKNALPVLMHNPYIDKIWEWNDENRLILGQMTFDEVLNSDKNRNSSAFAMQLNAREKLGFGLSENGAIIPLNKEALYNFQMGLDDELKFKKNQRTGLDILAETWRLNYENDEYVLSLTREEEEFCHSYRKHLGIGEDEFVVGFNTGCSAQFPLKKMTIEQHVHLIQRMHEQLTKTKILLFGGKEDTERNREIQSRVGKAALETPTTEGLRKGVLYVNLCDCLVSGDSLGMHIGIALKKHVVAWFGFSCGSEIEIYGRGEKILSDLECSPCWNSSCENPECIKSLNLNRIFEAVQKIRQKFMDGG